MKFLRIFLIAMFFMPVAVRAASNNSFMVAAQLLSAAKNADIQQVQNLINSGADVNYVDATGLSLVCTSLMNNDVRGAQILQMYGADASKCDQQIKQYNLRNKPADAGGLFSGLSSAHNLTLAAAGAAVVVGGLFLLTDVFDGGNNNSSSSSGSNDNRPGGDSGSGDGGASTLAFTLPYGPAMPNAESEAENYTSNLNLYSPSNEDSILYKNFDLMTNEYRQNYLLMMGGYSAFARGYLGMETLRNSTTDAPISLAGNNLGTTPVMGGRPVNVALITTNGINAVDDSSLGSELLAWTTTNDNGTSANAASNTMVSDKYYNNKLTLGTDDSSLSDDTVAEDGTLVDDFDLSGFGTAINNNSATDVDNLLAKVVGGKTSGYTDADFMGFMPNGQMTVFRTGGGIAMFDVAAENAVVSGSYTSATGTLQTDDTITLNGETLKITRTGNLISASAADDTTGTSVYSGYIGADGLLYLNSLADGGIDIAYSLSKNELILAKELGQADYYNYTALAKAAILSAAGDVAGGRSAPNIIANASVIAPLYSVSSATVNDILAESEDDMQTAFIKFVNQYYDNNETDGLTGANSLPGTTAASFFAGLGSSYSPLVIFSTGRFETDSTYSGATQDASFENSAPIVFDNLENLFMSVVAVGQTGTGTAGSDSVAGYNPDNKYALSQWGTDNGTPDDSTDNIFYKARACGSGGLGINGLDPWCFAAAGATDELAVAAAAGAAGAVQSAFSYLLNNKADNKAKNRQLFALLALTADGPYLGSTDDGLALTEASLISYLQSLYVLPTDYQNKVDYGTMDYLDAFKEVFGYGLINLERATMPGTSIYYYNGTDIVSGAGNAYWRAAVNTVFNSSAAFNPRAASISAPFYDVLESVDGELSMPRIWENSFALGVQSEKGLYMGDVLSELKTTKDKENRVEFGNLGFSMTSSEKAYVDNLNGLDTLQFDYSDNDFLIGAGYQRYFTDKDSRFSGMANPILSMVSNAVVSDAEYKVGNWAFAARAFSGNITDESMLENDPTVAAQYEPLNLGMVQGAQSGIGWNGARFGFNTAVGFSHESDTLLGAQTGGLLDLGNGNTMYLDSEFRFAPMDNVAVKLRATFAKTQSDAAGEFILGLSDVYSNAFALGVDAGNFSFAVSQPLTVYNGSMQYAYADYDIVESSDGIYDLVVKDTYIDDLNLSPDVREIRFSGSYRQSLGQFTDGALGFIYRVHPNNTDEFGNESIFMMKLTHRIGI